MKNEITRRDCLKHAAVGTAAIGLAGVSPTIAHAATKTRHVLAFSDIHIGRKDDELDGAEWMAKGLNELKKNKVPVDYAMVLGDIAHGATEQAFKTFVEQRDKSHIETWFELAGNHEYHGGTCKHYEKIVRSIKPYSHIDGNIAWLFISDENGSVQGDLGDEAYQWLEKSVREHQDKVVIVCSHQGVHGTTYKTTSGSRHIHPKEKIASLLENHRVDLWMSGHEHHRPYDKQNNNIVRKNDTTFINIASMSHAYGTKQSQSFVLAFAEGEKKIVARRRVHDDQEFDPKYETEIPLQLAIKLG